MAADYQLAPIGVVRSSLRDRAQAPMQGYEDAPPAWIEVDDEFRDALDGIREGDEVILLTWLHEAGRRVLRVHPRNDARQPLAGVFATRSPDRPSPIGLHRVRVIAIEGRNRVRVAPLEAIEGTSVLDIKPVLDRAADA